jgi:hypothetical protein
MGPDIQQWLESSYEDLKLAYEDKDNYSINVIDNKDEYYFGVSVAKRGVGVFLHFSVNTDIVEEVELDGYDGYYDDQGDDGYYDDQGDDDKDFMAFSQFFERESLYNARFKRRTSNEWDHGIVSHDVRGVWKEFTESIEQY